MQYKHEIALYAVISTCKLILKNKLRVTQTQHNKPT